MENYRIITKLNSGSFGSVFKIYRVSDHEEFVLKRIPLMDLDQAQRQQAKMEVDLMQQLRHPHIVPYFDAFLFNDEDLCIVMKFFRGGDLGEIVNSGLQRRSFLTEQQVMLWFVQISLAVHYLHSHRIIHRDLKTQNVFVDPQTGEVSIGDFGVAKILESKHTVTQQPSGTPLYMAPEVLQGNMCTFKSDVWALGCILYELLCFRHPFEAHDISGLVIKVVRGDYAPIPSMYSRHVARLVDRMLERDPRKRPLIDEILMTPFVKDYIQTYLSIRLPHGSADSYVELLLENQVSALGIHRQIVDVRTELQQGTMGMSHNTTNSLLSALPSAENPDEIIPPPVREVVYKQPLMPDRNPGRLGAGRVWQAKQRESDAKEKPNIDFGRRKQYPTPRQSNAEPTPTPNFTPSTDRSERSDVQRRVPAGRRRTLTDEELREQKNKEVKALYEACRERDNAYLRTKERSRIALHGGPQRSVKQVVDSLEEVSLSPTRSPSPQRLNALEAEIERYRRLVQDEAQKVEELSRVRAR